MTEKIYSIPEIQTILFPVFRRNNVKKAILFGSYGKQTACSKSDIDLLVDSGLHGLQFVGLGEEIRAALDKDVDLFDVTHIEPSSQLYHEIDTTGVLLYEK